MTSTCGASMSLLTLYISWVNPILPSTNYIEHILPQPGKSYPTLKKGKYLTTLKVLLTFNYHNKLFFFFNVFL